MSVNEKMTAIADAIRGKTGGTEALTLDQMAQGVAGIDGLDEGIIALLARGGSYSNLQTVTIPKAVKSIGVNLFREWYYCERVIFHDGVTSIGQNAFTFCGELASLELPARLESIGYSAFNSCRKIKTLTIPASVSAIGNTAFSNCSGLTVVTFEGTPTSIGANAFSGCTDLKDFIVPWEEDEVAGFPWGAPNATINYINPWG